jgi:rhodanese-related sulfurtransferase
MQFVRNFSDGPERPVAAGRARYGMSGVGGGGSHGVERGVGVLSRWLPFGSVPEIPAAELAEAMRGARPPQIVDVRTPAEWRGSHIPGAVSVPILGWPAALDRLGLDPGRPVVAICLTAHRSIPAVRMLAERGFDARHLAGGMRSWWAEGLPTEP